MLLDFLFPRRCLDCGKWGQYFCPSCRKKIIPLEKQICPVCNKPSIYGLTHPCCQTKYSLDGLASIFPYEGVIKKAITKLKYKFITDLAQDLIELIAFPFQAQIRNSSFLIRNSTILAPIPLHSYRKRQRGFNQAELLGEILAKKFGWQFRADVLKRIRYTKPQVKLKKEERGKNIRGAFAFNKNSLFVIRDSKFILFDDVWTTGATLREAGNILKRGRVKKVYGLTLAR